MEKRRKLSEPGAGGTTPHSPAGPNPATTLGPWLYRLLVESVRDYAIFALDSRGHIATWNLGAQRIKGYSADEVLGKHFSIFYPEADKAAGKPAWELEVAVQEGKFEEEGWRVRKDGSQFWANVVITTLRDSNGEVVGFGKVTRDLTERRASQMRAIEDARLLAEAEAANRAKSEFLAAMSHELRTPLNAIGGYADLLQAGVAGTLTPPQAEYLARIRGSQQHLLGIISDLLNYSRIEAGELAYDFADVPAVDMVEKVAALIEVQATAKGVTIDRGLCRPNLICRVDRTKAEQVLLNIMSNAVKYTPRGGRVVTSCDEHPRGVAIRVRDTGPGVPPEQQESIFEPFVQLGRTLSSAHEGTGLGLAISRDLARAMRGDVYVESDGQSGSTFTVVLPRAAS